MTRSVRQQCVDAINRTTQLCRDGEISVGSYFGVPIEYSDAWADTETRADIVSELRAYGMDYSTPDDITFTLITYP
jgi:hypothetical protein